jgi:hypothetical protein
MKIRAWALPAVLAATAAFLISQPAPPELPGPNSDGSVTLVSGWKLRPAGRQIALSTFPMASQLSPDGKYLLVLQGGYLKPSISVHTLPALAEVERVELEDAWLGMAFAGGNSRTLYVSGGSQACVFEYSLSASGKLEKGRTFPIVPADKRDWQDFIGDVQVSPDGRLIYAAMLYRNTIAVINPQSGMIIEQFKTGPRPYRILFHPDGKSFFVTSWSDGSLYHHDANDGRQLWRLGLGSGLMDMAWRDKPTQPAEGSEFPYSARLFVAASNSNQVHVVGLTASKEARRIETLNVALSPRQPAGMTPSSLALSTDQDKLFVVCSDANAVAVADVSGPRSALQGFVPTGWYPTATRQLPAGALVVFNGKGERIQTGSMSIVEDFADKLPGHTKTVLANSPYRDAVLETPRPDLPQVEHVVYIIKESRTYDQVLGDLGIGNGDPSLTLFGENVSPNHHKLAREFVLLDNFYVSADVSADGHNWSTAAIAPAYVQRMWPNSYGGRRKHDDYEGGEAAALPPAGYLWTNAAQKGVAIRNYGWWGANITPAPAEGPQIAAVRDPVLAKVTCMEYRGFDLDYPDVERVKPFLKELAQAERNGKLAQLVLLKIPNDHTSGTAAGKVSALSAVADNDVALGTVVEALSKSRFWPKMAIFILEAAAQNGPDHVDSHRSPAYVISPWTRGRGIDSTMYNTTSMLRTIELLLGLRPMTHFDAAARPMTASFSRQPDARPYSAEKVRIPLDERNAADTPVAARSARLDFTEPSAPARSDFWK